MEDKQADMLAKMEDGPDDLSASDLEEEDMEVEEKEKESDEPKDLSGDGGVMKRIVKKGSGYKKPSKGAEVSVHYVGTLESTGEEFDSSRGRGEPFKFVLDKGQVIKGWDIGVASMRKGETAVFTLKPEYAYGKAGSPPKIPADATLVFEVELLDWSDEDDLLHDGGLMKKVVREGEGWKRPKEDEKVTVRLALHTAEGVEVQATHEVQFTVKCDEAPFPGLDDIVMKMKKGEAATVRVSPQYAFGAAGGLEGKVPPNTALTADVELLSWDAGKESWELKDEEKLAEGERLKNEGNDMFKAGRLDIALRRYKKGYEMVQYLTPKDSDLHPRVDALAVACLLNRSAVNLKRQAYRDVLEDTKKALEKEPSNVKALYRRGQALAGLDEWLDAEQALRRVLEVDPKNTDAVRALRDLRKKQTEQNKRDAAMFKNMFKGLSAPSEVKAEEITKDADKKDEEAKKEEAMEVGGE